tara:strand:- start:1552 stop:1974 length:423 start_codon:yes stop_codon:yes gene_type:complete
MKITTAELALAIKEGLVDFLEEKNPWAICTAKVGREDKEKYEKCVLGVKKQLKEAAYEFNWGVKGPSRVANQYKLSPLKLKGIIREELSKVLSEEDDWFQRLIRWLSSTTAGREARRQANAADTRTEKSGVDSAYRRIKK